MKNNFNRKLKRIIAFFAFTCILTSALTAQKTPVENLYEYRFPNGLTLFVAQNNTVPLAYIEIAVRTGALNQRPENAGLFHLYEHMMFKGNTLYPDAASVNRAMSALGVASWNGTTSVDRVNYFFTIPDSKLKEGLLFWSEAVRNPLMDSVEFENEKKVVLAEIEGDENNPARIYADYINMTMFHDAPWRTDAAGNPDAVRNATVDQLKQIQKQYYVPSNSALFIGGNVDPAETYRLVKEIYGSWENTQFQEKNSQKDYRPQDKTPFEKTEYACLKYDAVPPELGIIEIRFRGPDTDFDLHDTYVADYLYQVLNDPDGIYCRTIMQDMEFAVPGVDYITNGYLTVRANGAYSFSISILNPQDDIASKSEYFKNLLMQQILPQVAQDKSVCSRKNKRKIVSRLSDERVLEAQTASGLLSNLSFWWSKVSPDYYYSYIKEISKVSRKDIKNFIQKYFTQEPLVTFIVNSAVNVPSENVEFKTIQKDNSLWYKNNYSQEYIESLFVPAEHKEEKSQFVKNVKSIKTKDSSAAQIKTYTLKNGIPVYVNRTKNSKVSAMNIAVRGGVEHLSPQTSGLENALFSMMKKSSKNYSSTERERLEFETGSSISSLVKLSGSALCLNSLDKYFYKMVPVFTDGFLNPLFDQESYSVLKTQINQKISSTQNNPDSLLFYTIRKELYKGHVYETDSGVTVDSAENITLENLMLLHERILNAQDIFVVVSGNVNPRKVIRLLNKNLGKLKAENDEQKNSGFTVEPLKVHAQKDFVIKHPSADGTGYAARVFQSPANTDDDYIPAVIAARMYSDVLFNVVREHYGTCYTPTSYVVGSKAPYGSEYLYKLSDPADFKKYVAEARDCMSRGLCIEGLNENGSYKYVSQKDALEQYKNSYINETYAGNSTNAAVADTLTYNLLQFDDIYYDKKQFNDLESLTPEKLQSVFKKYWLSENARWFIIN